VGEGLAKSSFRVVRMEVHNDKWSHDEIVQLVSSSRRNLGKW